MPTKERGTVNDGDPSRKTDKYSVADNYPPRKLILFLQAKTATRNVTPAAQKFETNCKAKQKEDTTGCYC